jgi:arylsulfatase
LGSSRRPPSAASPRHRYGVSFAHSFDDANAATRHHTQYFEMFGHRALDHDGWRAVSPWPGPSFAEAGKPFGTAISAETLARLDAEGWELYHVAEDFAETNNVAAENRTKLVELIAQWYVEAGRYGVLPIDGTAVTRLMTERPQLTEARTSYTFWPGTEAVPFAVAPRVLNRPHSITADVEIPVDGAEGVLLCQGANNGGFTFYVQDKRLHWAHNYVGRDIYRVSSADPVPEGRHQLRFEFEPTGKPDFTTGKGAPGRAQLYVDRDLVAHTDVPVTTPVCFNPGSLSCGANPSSAVVPDYQPPFRFTGVLHSVTVDLSGDLITDSESEMRLAMSRQ